MTRFDWKASSRCSCTWVSRWKFRFAIFASGRSSDRSASRLVLQSHHHAGHQVFRLLDAFRDQLNVHLGFARLPRALAIDAMLADEHQGVGEQIERHGEPAPLHACLLYTSAA